MEPGYRSVLTVRHEICELMSKISHAQVEDARAMFTDSECRWFCSGQGRSGLVAQMTAMRLMHLGFKAHAVGEATAPSTGNGDGLIMISGSGETAMSTHFVDLARKAGTRILAITKNAQSTLGRAADRVIEVPVIASQQFGGSLFEQCALLSLDALVIDLSRAKNRAYDSMALRHTNLQ